MTPVQIADTQTLVARLTKLRDHIAGLDSGSGDAALLTETLTALAASMERERRMREALETIADFAPGNGDVCEIIAKRARAALAEQEGLMTEPTEMELRVAKAIHDAKESQVPRRIRSSWERCDQESRNYSLLYARAAIRAMREPTDEMKAAAVFDYNFDPEWGAWTSMIDAASPGRE